MSDPSARMLELLSLLQNGRSWQAWELARRLDTSARTLRRDIDRLRTLGYPVSSSPGPGGHYQLVAGRALPPLLLSDDEAVASAVGLRIAAAALVGDISDSAERARSKLERVLPSRLRSRMEAVAASTDVAARTTSTVSLRTVQLLASAAHTRQHVRFDYTSRTGRHNERRVEPYRQVLLGRRWYLLGWDRDRAGWRTFRLDRIANLAVPGTTFLARDLPSEDPVSFVQDSARFPITRHRGVVRFAAPIATVSERLFAEAGSLEAIDDTSCRYITGADSWEWLSITVAMVGVPFTIEGPPEFISHARELLERLEQAIPD